MSVDSKSIYKLSQEETNNEEAIQRRNKIIAENNFKNSIIFECIRDAKKYLIDYEFEKFCYHISKLPMNKKQYTAQWIYNEEDSNVFYWFRVFIKLVTNNHYTWTKERCYDDEYKIVITWNQMHDIVKVYKNDIFLKFNKELEF